jgi:orotate phosphoribosyltransferase
VQAIEAAREHGFEVIGAMCLVDRQQDGGRENVERAAAPAPFVALFTAKDVREEHLRQAGQEKSGAPPIFAISAKCEFCDRPAVTNAPGNRCEAHRP